MYVPCATPQDRKLLISSQYLLATPNPMPAAPTTADTGRPTAAKARASGVMRGVVVRTMLGSGEGTGKGDTFENMQRKTVSIVRPC